MSGKDAVSDDDSEPAASQGATSGSAFDRSYWDERWAAGDASAGSMSVAPPNPHLVEQIAALPCGTALEAGCGAGSEALWLASHGWRVTAVDISGPALQMAAQRAQGGSGAERIDWVRADLTTWHPGCTFDLVTTHYAHSSMPQLDFYERLAEWVKPGGTLFIVGHLNATDTTWRPGVARGHAPAGRDTGEHAHGHAGDRQPPQETKVTADGITARLDPARWQIVAAREVARAVPLSGGQGARLRDVVVRAARIR